MPIPVELSAEALVNSETVDASKHALDCHVPIVYYQQAAVGPCNKYTEQANMS